jgi:hypothetical protein
MTIQQAVKVLGDANRLGLITSARGDWLCFCAPVERFYREAAELAPAVAALHAAGFEDCVVRPDAPTEGVE